MKKQLLLMLAGATLSMAAMAQAQPKFYINGFGGYTFNSSFTLGGYAGEIKGNGHYGGSLEFVIPRMSSAHNEKTIELSYQGMTTDLEGWTYVLGGYKRSVDRVSVNYITIGGNNYFGRSRKIMGYGGLNLGAGWLDNKDNGQSEVKFAAGIKGGGRFMFTDNIGLKLYAQLNSVIGGIGGGFYFGTGGAGYGVSTYSTLLQFGLGGGLTIGLGGAKPAGRPASSGL